MHERLVDETIKPQPPLTAAYDREMPPFSQRTGWDISESLYAAAVREVRQSSLPIFDLTRSNPTVCGLDYDEEAILRPLRHAGALRYDPDPRGMCSAREAVAGYYVAKGIEVDAAQIQLTTSTSEGYSYLFRLLCDPGAEILIPQPSYPLFDFLARIDDVQIVSYPLFQDFGWHIDLAELESRITPRTRAILLVHPNNPTGHYTSHQERAALEEVCRRHDLALIVDEVFLDYALEGAGQSFAAGDHPVLTFVLSGLSKIAALPQMKVGWVVTLGPEEEQRQALGRLEVIADTFLSLNAPAQLALPHWLEGSTAIRRQIEERTSRNLAAVDALLTEQGTMDRYRVDAGWSAVLRLPATRDDQELAIHLIQEQRALVHPGSFYGFPSKGRIVVSLLTPEEEFLEGMRRVFEGSK